MVMGKEVPERYPERYMEAIRKLRFIDDTFFTVSFDGFIKGMQLLLRIILQRDDLEVKEAVTQRTAGNLYGRDVRFDVLAEDSDGKLYNCEIQRAEEGAGALRARHNSSMMDSRALARGKSVEELPETWVIFITESDVLGGGFPLYHINRTIEEMAKPFEDKAHIVYVNGACRDDSALGLLMQDFFNSDPEKLHYKELQTGWRISKNRKTG